MYIQLTLQTWSKYSSQVYSFTCKPLALTYPNHFLKIYLKQQRNIEEMVKITDPK